MTKNYLAKSLATVRLLAFLLICIGLWTSSSMAQTISSYSFTQTNGTYKQAGLGAALTVPTSTYDDGSFAAITLPFTFTYHGTSMTQVVMNANGNARFGAAGYTGYSGTTSSTDDLCPLSADLYGLSTTAGHEMSYATLGQTPNRIFVMQWYNWGFYSTGLNEVSFQIRLYETTNTVQFVYGPAPGVNSRTAYVGLNGTTSADFQTRTTTTDWNATTAGAANNNTCTVSATVRPLNGLTFTWTAAATVTAMPFSQTTGTFIPIEAAGATGTFTPTAAFYDDANFGIATIPFSFTYHGLPFTQLSAGPNGYAQLTGTSTSLGYSAMCSNANVLSPINADLYGNSNVAIRGDASYFTIGTTPNRVFVMQWSNWGFYGGALNEISFQIRLTETTSTISFVYGPQPGTGSRTAYVGLTGATTADFQGRTTITNWAATTASGTSCTSSTYSSTVRPANGLTFNWAPPTSTPCSGTPNPAGNTLADNNPGCASTTTTLSIANTYTGISGLAYQWQSSPTGSGYTNVGGATNSTYAAVIATTAYYQCVVTCTSSGLSATSTPLQVVISAQGCYCTNSYTPAQTTYYISNVTTTGGISNFNNSSTSALVNGYSNYTGISVSQYQNGTVNWTIACGPTGYTYGIGIWIDWNQNGSFADAGEQIYVSGSYLTGASGSLTVPIGATPGNTRMRVVANYLNTSPTACTGTTYTEAEDYTFNVLLLPACTGTPTPGNTISSVATACSGTNFTLSLQNLTVGSGVTYQWQTSPNGTAWTNGAGASTNATYIT
ncbi:MAG: GEVED domain-containing protein, partial [Bacteroidota bacterium]